MPQLADAHGVYAYASDAAVTRFLAWPRHTSLKESEQFLQKAMAGWQKGNYLLWLIEDAEGVVGAIGCTLSGVNAGIGYVLARDHWGRGYATEALTLLVDALFRETPVSAVWALCVIENSASKRVLEKSGFRFLRTLTGYLPCPNLKGERKDVWLFGRERG